MQQAQLLITQTCIFLTAKSTLSWSFTNANEHIRDNSSKGVLKIMNTHRKQTVDCSTLHWLNWYSNDWHSHSAISTLNIMQVMRTDQNNYSYLTAIHASHRNNDNSTASTHGKNNCNQLTKSTVFKDNLTLSNATRPYCTWTVVLYGPLERCEQALQH